MKAMRRAVVAVLAGLIFWVPSTVVPAEPKDSQSPKRQPPSPPQAATDPVYKPPPRGTPGGRVGGGTRGTPGRDIFVLSVLAPDHTGRTIHEQPSLFWFISTETSLPVELTIVDPNVVEPVLQTRIASPVERGVHRVRLADHGVRLAAGVAYQWSVTVVPDATRRSHDILASGTIERVEAGGELASKLSAAREEDRVAVYAEAGIWYDALETVCDLIEHSPEDATPRRFRAALLKQAGLPEIMK